MEFFELLLRYNLQVDNCKHDTLLRICQVGAVDRVVSGREWKARTRKAPSVLSLFNMKLRSKLLNERVLSHGELRELHDLHVCFCWLTRAKFSQGRLKIRTWNYDFCFLLFIFNCIFVSKDVKRFKICRMCPSAGRR